MPPELKTTVPLSALGSHLKIDFEYFKRDIENFDRNKAIITCLQLNNLLSYPPYRTPEGQQLACELLYNDSIVDKLSMTKINEYLINHGGLDRHVVIARSHLLELVRWICVYGSQSNGGWEWASQKAFIKALLTAFEFWSRRVQRPTFKRIGTNEEKLFNILPAMRESSMWSSPAKPPLEALGYGDSVLTEFFTEKYSKIFEEKTGLSLLDFQACVTGLMCIFNPDYYQIKSLKNAFIFSSNDLWLNCPHMRNQFQQFLLLESQPIEDLVSSFNRIDNSSPEQPFDLRSLRSKPILRVDHDRYLILDPQFLADRATVGPFFHLLDRTNQQQAFIDFGDAFHRTVASNFENYSKLERLKEARFPTPRIGPKATHANTQKNKKEIADILLVCDGALMFIEAKGVWIRDSSVTSDSDKFWREIKRQYSISVDANTGEENRKGIAQLADNIKGLLCRELIPEEHIIINKDTEIFPILFSFDEHMAAPHIGYFLSKEFTDLFEHPVKTNGAITFDSSTIHLPIILTLDSMDEFERYHAYKPIKVWLKEYSLAEPDRHYSFKDYLRSTKVPKDQLTKDPKSLVIEAGQKSFSMATKRLFNLELVDE